MKPARPEFDNLGGAYNDPLRDARRSLHYSDRPLGALSAF
jgi:hypothetical protein